MKISDTLNNWLLLKKKKKEDIEWVCKICALRGAREIFVQGQCLKILYSLQKKKKRKLSTISWMCMSRWLSWTYFHSLCAVNNHKFMSSHYRKEIKGSVENYAKIFLPPQLFIFSLPPKMFKNTLKIHKNRNGCMCALLSF